MSKRDLDAEPLPLTIASSQLKSARVTPFQNASRIPALSAAAHDGNLTAKPIDIIDDPKSKTQNPKSDS